MGKWVNTKKKENEFIVEDSIMISEETIRQINDQISFLEKTKKQVNDKEKKNQTNYLKISNSFFKKSCNSSSLPDICFQTSNSNIGSEESFKLKGGSRLKIFDTEETDRQDC